MSAPIIAVDLGTVRIGLAIAGSLELPAVPLQTLQHASRERDVEAVVAVARERGATTIVVGYPLRLDGTHGPAAERVDRFVTALRAGFDGEVIAVDERLSTAAASKRLLDGGLSGSKRRRVIDQMAAVEILDSYLSRRRADTAPSDGSSYGG